MTYLVEVLESRTLFAVGPLDPTFGAGGRAAVDVPAAHADTARAVAIDAGGRVVVAGRTLNPQGSAGDGVIVLRYRPDGMLDPTFGVGGRATVPGTGSSGGGGTPLAQAVAIDRVGRIVVAFDNFAFARFNADGS